MWLAGLRVILHEWRHVARHWHVVKHSYNHNNQVQILTHCFKASRCDRNQKARQAGEAKHRGVPLRTEYHGITAEHSSTLETL